MSSNFDFFGLKSSRLEENEEKKEVIAELPPPIQFIDNAQINLVENRDLEVLHQNIPAEFPMTSDQFDYIKRTTTYHSDCVINGLSAINIINQQQADILRIITGRRGMYDGVYENIFRYIFPSKKWKMVGMDAERLYLFCIYSLKPGHLLFCKYPGHLYILSKDRYGDVIQVDPQQNPVTCYLYKVGKSGFDTKGICERIRFDYSKNHSVLCSFPSFT
jgi:hypothetical protein